MSGDSYCLIGALNQVATGRWNWSCDSPRGLVKYFNKVACNRGFKDGWHVESNVIAFNNHPDTTHEDVMLFLKEALYEVKNEERGSDERSATYSFDTSR